MAEPPQSNPLTILKALDGLTKMMRVDPQDREDIRFLLEQSDYDATGFSGCLRDAICPDVPEIHDAFEKNRAWLRSFGIC